MTTYIFNESGCIPGIPGTFANCRVDVHDDGNLFALPLAYHPAFEAPAEAQAPAIVQEQGTSDLAPTSN